jgi:hypothetical protein
VTRRRLARLLLIYISLFSFGLAGSQLAAGARWKVFGWGLMVPGGGFLALADVETVHGALHIGIAGLTLLTFVAALFLWFATANIAAPPAVWILSAFAAALMDHGVPRHGPALPVVLAMFAAAITLASASVRRRRGRTQREASNAYLTEIRQRGVARVCSTDHVESASEFTPQELKLMRFLLDRALQPTTSYEGFEWLDQFQTAAVRYQLNFTGYALSMAQATRLSALGGYLDTAQRNLIDKQTDHRVWRYWALENLWGNLAVDADPVARDNVMFTGFCATQIAMYHAASGRRDYDRRGSFALRHPSGLSYGYDLPSLIDALDRERRRSAFQLVACEPNWVYPLCNTIAAAAVMAHDRMTGSGRWAMQADGFRRSLENEFIDLSGRFVPCRSALTGLALPIAGGAQPQAMPCFFLNATLPDVAQRQWMLLRRDLVDVRQPGALDRRRFWPIDTGNYRLSRAAAFAATALAAVELGDRDVAQLCLDALEEDCPPALDGDSFHRPKASVWSHAVEFFSRSGRADGFRHLIGHPRDTAPRPRISDVPYPDVLVARAGHRDGLLSAVLYPGERKGFFQLGLSGLAPRGAYVCDGTEEMSIAADAQGEATITVALAGRTEIRIRPTV